jgi:hypothetical protein
MAISQPADDSAIFFRPRPGNAGHNDLATGLVQRVDSTARGGVRR